MNLSNGTLNQSALGLHSVSTIVENKSMMCLNQEESKEVNEKSYNIDLGAAGSATQNFVDIPELGKKRFSSSGEEDEQGKKSLLQSKFSGTSSASSEEDKFEEIKTNKEWGISRIVPEEWDEEDEESQYEKRRQRIDLEQPVIQRRTKNILKRNFSVD